MVRTIFSFVETRPVGRPCTTCAHSDRNSIELALSDGLAISRISAMFTVSRSSLRRHRSGHMSVDLRDGGLGAYDVVLRLVETADRLHDLATESEEAHRYADAVRASLAEARSLHLLLDLGVNGQREVDYAADAQGLEAAVAALVQRVPVLGDQLADELEEQKRNAFATKLRAYTEKCRQLPEHQANQVSGNKELNHAT